MNRLKESFMIVLVLCLVLPLISLAGCRSGAGETPPSSDTTPNEGISDKITFVPDVPDPATVGVPYSFSFYGGGNPSGGHPPYSFSLGSGVGFPPMGLILNVNGLLSGTPKVAGTYKFEVSVKDLDGNQASGMVSLIVNPAPKNGSDKPNLYYDGTYTGVFNYEYNAYDGKLVGVWTPATLNIRITFKARDPSHPWLDLDITSVWADDPTFGTGPDGIIALPGESFGEASLPRLPMAPNDPPPTGTGCSIPINFPNGSGIYPSLFWEEGFYVSPDGKTLSSYPHTPIDMFGSSNTWSVNNQLSDIFSARLGVINNGYYVTRQPSWSLTKVSP